MTESGGVPGKQGWGTICFHFTFLMGTINTHLEIGKPDCLIF
jgi:hypothetical protein